MQYRAKDGGFDLYECPLAAVDQRLADLHRHWHIAEAAYFDPDAFRVGIQTAIQTARTVTFILQAQKAIFPDFDEWYSGWQDRFRADTLMRWMVNARNRIEKQGDLETHSWVRAEIVASHLSGEGPRIDAPAELFDAPWKIVRAIPRDALGEHLRNKGTLRIERRWVENTLPDWELLDAVATTYGRLAELVADAHGALGLTEPETVGEGETVFGPGFREGRLPCMVGHADRRAKLFGLLDGRPLTITTSTVKVDISKRAELEAHYGMTPKEMFPKPKGASAEEFAEATFEAARKVFLKDGYHAHINFLLKKGVLVQLAESRIDDPGQKYLLSKKLGDHVRLSGADAVLLIDEIWTAPFDPAFPYRGAAEAPNRGEALAASLAQRDGDIVRWTAQIHRDGDKVTLGKTRRERGGAAFHFAHVYEAWGKEIPAAWRATGA
ncbi:hypothetical protein IWC96_12830 [Brevundimonas sp. BAL450]|uniref:hypothetical protein n=1 Tax=Brevundimonas TaxID=41275 RepID=UPI0005EC37C5|nr:MULTISPECIES: hypothetical protein [Brevundimonas]MBG7616155.1 hypothetical protein [Brevundimonas sp. BAL450]